MASRRRARQARIDASIAATPDFARTICYTRSYIEEVVQLLELAHRAHVLFESQPATEKRKLLDFVLSNCIWKGGELAAKYRQPFDVLAVAVASEQQRVVGEMAETAKNEIWLPVVDSNQKIKALIGAGRVESHNAARSKMTPVGIPFMQRCGSTGDNPSRVTKRRVRVKPALKGQADLAHPRRGGALWLVKVHLFR